MPASLFHTLNISKQDILSRLYDLDVTSNNLANVNTAGYKTNRSNFQELLDQQIKDGTKLAGTQLLMRQGTLKATENPFDMAIQGDGFFSVTLPDGTIGYTRNGEFGLDADLNLVSGMGYPLVWDGTVEEGMTDVHVNPNGTVTAKDADGVVAEIGTVPLTRFSNPTGLTAYGDNVWLESDNSGAPQEGAGGDENYGIIVGQTVEQSNVDLGQEMTHLLTLQRAFSMSIKAFQQTDMMISQAINLRKA
jgi:flagellar basal-body rod protein FlgG